MTPNQALAVAVRLFAIVFLIYMVRELLAFYASGLQQGDPYLLPIVAIVSVLATLFVVVLWFFPRTIARGLLPSSSEAPVQASPPDIWFATGSCLIGLWLMASAVPALARNPLVLYFFRNDSVDMSGLRSGLLYYSIQFVVGVGLLLGASGLRKVFLWVRNAGAH
jgi:hypothetical protein